MYGMVEEVVAVVAVVNQAKGARDVVCTYIPHNTELFTGRERW